MKSSDCVQLCIISNTLYNLINYDHKTIRLLKFSRKWNRDQTRFRRALIGRFPKILTRIEQICINHCLYQRALNFKLSPSELFRSFLRQNIYVLWGGEFSDLFQFPANVTAIKVRKSMDRVFEKKISPIFLIVSLPRNFMIQSRSHEPKFVPVFHCQKPLYP